MNKLKELILKTNYFEDNIYLNKYINLILTCKNNKKERFKTQSHHFIPVSYYRIKYKIKEKNGQNDLSLNKADSDFDNFRINLLFKDHILAHYYLCLCSKGQLRYLLNIAFINMSQIFKEDFNLIKESLDKYQLLYEDYSREKSAKYKKKVFKVSSFYKNLSPKEKLQWGYKINESRKKLNWEPLEETINRISKIDLETYYIKENHSKEETASHFNTNDSKIDCLMKYYNLHKFRTKKQCLEIIDLLNKDIELIKDLYLNQNYTQQSLADLYNCNINLMQYFLSENNIYKYKNTL